MNELTVTLGRRKLVLPAESAVVGQLPQPKVRPLPVFPRIDRTYKAGWEYDLTNEQYHSRREFVSSTGLRRILSSPAAFHEFLVTQEEDAQDPDATIRTENKTFKLGSLVHECILEPQKFLQKFVLMPEFVGMTKDGRPSTRSAEALKKKEDWLKALPPGVNIVEEETFHHVIGMVKAILDHPEARSIFERTAEGELSKGVAEISGFYPDPETGLLLRIRPDFIRFDLGICAEVKTARSSDRRIFAAKIHEYGYHVQLAMQCEGIKAITGEEVDLPLFVAVESKPPYEVGVYTACAETMKLGMRLKQHAVRKIVDCMEKNQWPRRQMTAENISVPKYAFEEEIV